MIGPPPMERVDGQRNSLKGPESFQLLYTSEHRCGCCAERKWAYAPEALFSDLKSLGIRLLRFAASFLKKAIASSQRASSLMNGILDRGDW